jgi:hypothetical protein
MFLSSCPIGRLLLGTEAARAPEAASAPDGVGQLADDDDVRGVDALEHELGDAIAGLDGEVGVAEVEEDDLDGPAVVGVDDAGAHVDAVLGREAGAGGYAAVWRRNI